MSDNHDGAAGFSPPTSRVSGEATPGDPLICHP
jgi:hypothetical protein